MVSRVRARSRAINKEIPKEAEMAEKSERIMVKLNRRAFLRASATTLGGALLTACVAAPAGQPQAAAPEAVGEQLDIVWRTTFEEQPKLEQIFSEFETEHPDVTINATFLPGEQFDQKVDLMIAAGTPPAIWAPIAGRGIRYYAARDLCTPIDDFIANDGYDMTDFYPGSLDLCQWKGQFVGLPMLLLPVFLVYNKTLFDEAGIDYPTKDWDDKSWNWDAALELAKQLTKQDASGATTQYGYGGWGDTRYAVRSLGVNYWSKEDQDAGYPTKWLGTTPEFINAWQFMADFINVHKAAPSPAEQQAMTAGGVDIFMTGKIAMATGNSSAFKVYADIEEFEWGTAPMPWPLNDLPRWNFLYPDQYAIIQGQKYPDAAWELLKKLASPEAEKLHPIQSHGAVAPRQSLADYFIELAMESSGLPHEEIQVATDGMQYMSTAPGHATVEWQQYWDKAIAPSFDRMMLAEITAEEAVQEVEPLFDEIMQATTPTS
jgi:multiple sugar transport system substrate-binding protein